MAISKVKLPDNSTQDIKDSRIASTDITNWNGKQDALVSGTNIKTVNNESLLGSGNISVAGTPGEPGTDGVGISSVVQTTESTESGGTNVITINKTDGTSSTFNVRNGDAVGSATIVQTTGDSTTAAMSQDAVSKEVVAPDITYTEADFANDWVDGYYYTDNYAGNVVKSPIATYSILNRLIDIRDYDTIINTGGGSVWRYLLLNDEGNVINTVIAFGNNRTITRTQYPKMAWLSLTVQTSEKSVACTITLSNGKHLREKTPSIFRSDIKCQCTSFRVNQQDLMKVYSGSRMTNKTIVIMASARTSYLSLMRGTVNVDYVSNWCNIYKDNSISTTLCRFYNSPTKQSATLILTFDSSGNMNVYLNDVLKTSCTYDALPDTGWELYIGSQIMTHFSILNCALDNYVGIINNYGLMNWIPSLVWSQSAATVTESKSSAGWLGSGYRGNALLHGELTLTNTGSSSASLEMWNMVGYPSSVITVPAGETVNADVLIDLRNQGSFGYLGSGLTAQATGTYVVFEWGIDYRYCREGGFYNLAGMEWEDCPYLQLLTDNVLPDVLGSDTNDSANAASAVGQLRLDTSGNLYMWNGSVWKQINNS